jgi:hypothetical protein
MWEWMFSWWWIRPIPTPGPQSSDQDLLLIKEPIRENNKKWCWLKGKKSKNRNKSKSISFWKSDCISRSKSKSNHNHSNNNNNKRFLQPAAKPVQFLYESKCGQTIRRSQNLEFEPLFATFGSYNKFEDYAAAEEERQVF